MSKRKTKRDIHAIPIEAPVTITAASDEGGDKPPRFDVVAYTGDQLDIARYQHPVVVDLAGMTFRNSLVANLDHDPKQRVGNVTEIATDNNELRLGGTASAATPAKLEVVASAKDGFVWQASIEAMPSKVDFVAAGKTATVNGRDFTGPIYVAKASTLRGFAFVSHGADDNTSVTIAAEDAASNQESNTMDPKLTKWIEANLPGVDADSLTDARIASLQTMMESEEGGGSGDRNTPLHFETLIAKKKEEAERQEILAAVAEEWFTMHPDRESCAIIEAFTRKAIAEHWSADKLRVELYTHLKAPPSHGFKTPEKDVLTSKVIEAAICEANRLPNIDAHYDDQTLQTAHDKFPSGISLKQLYFVCAKANGFDSRYQSEVTLDVQRHAFGMLPGGRNRDIQAAGFSNVSLSGILSNILNKFVIDQFNAVDSAWRVVSSIRAVRDFKQVSSYSLSGDLDYEFVGPTGEIKHGDLGQTTYTNKADTYARMLAITRTDIVNDDLGALTAAPRRLGRGGATKLNNVFWTEFLDNSSFFAAGNSNVSTGAGSALGLAGIEAAEVVFQNQTDPDGQPMGLMPAVLLVPPTLKATALTLMNSQLVVTGTNSTIPDANIWGGRFVVASSPYMENSSYTGYSTAAWYLLANPSDSSTIETVFLNGREAPVVETADADFNTLGVQIRGYHDFGVSKMEYRSGVRSAGS